MSAAVGDLTTWLPLIFVFKAGAIHHRDLQLNHDGPCLIGRGPSRKVFTFAQTHGANGPHFSRDRFVVEER
jgi:hypothetical protein